MKRLHLIKDTVEALVGFIGNITGNVTGDVTGNTTGKHFSTFQALTATGAITGEVVTLAHDSTPIAATLAAPVAGQHLIIKNMSTNTTAHTVTCAAGVTFDGTNHIATLDAAGDMLMMVAISATRWVVLVNTGSVAFSK